MLLRGWINFLFALSFGLGFGVWSAQFAVQNGSASPSSTNGAWQAIEEISANENNPYVLAHTALHGNLKLSNFEALYFTAGKDDLGRKLAGNCDYVLKGKSPDARWWSLTIYNKAGNLIANQADRYSFNSTNLKIYDGRDYTISLATNARAGNWIPIKADASFVIMLRLYLPNTNSIRDTRQIAFPVIERLRCS